MIVVVPARGGSKRIPHKNIAALAGRPLLARTLDQARDAGLLANVVVSTDAEPIAAVARDCGARVIMRPADLASDTASTEAALLHVLDVLADEGRHDEWIMTLPPTSPFREASTIRAFADAVHDLPAEVDCLMSVTETRGDYWRRLPDGSFRRLFPDAPRRQQDREPLFEENSAIYVTRVAALRDSGIILGRGVEGRPIGWREALDINTPDDLALAEALLASGRRPVED
ncbi:N-Acetylneuraminate cytidylyltransferase [Caenispirillum salinarum AK4]|uniref:N-Acetylneuraminate cytidylyltransferase n=1 Tax=Caenispirillum salinarum AK4 TaxID=1238182 RepID=K9GLY0_9PROT|nr:acylneuraminate cytidylyltransferase family protein [Caenispirillum salinarum]EKV26057.1 N-Acetylneuraminate cytidylyltransferase [Caenispirillum salinarum AK4]